jgi:hypothetical protein
MRAKARACGTATDTAQRFLSCQLKASRRAPPAIARDDNDVSIGVLHDDCYHYRGWEVLSFVGMGIVTAKGLLPALSSHVISVGDAAVRPVEAADIRGPCQISWLTISHEKVSLAATLVAARQQLRNFI